MLRKYNVDHGSSKISKTFVNLNRFMLVHARGGHPQVVFLGLPLPSVTPSVFRGQSKDDSSFLAKYERNIQLTLRFTIFQGLIHLVQSSLKITKYHNIKKQ